MSGKVERWKKKRGGTLKNKQKKKRKELLHIATRIFRLSISKYSSGTLPEGGQMLVLNTV